MLGHYTTGPRVAPSDGSDADALRLYCTALCVEGGSPAGVELLLLPSVVNRALVEPVGVFHRPYLLTYDVVVRLHGHAAPPRCDGLVGLAVTVQGQAFAIVCERLGGDVVRASRCAFDGSAVGEGLGGLGVLGLADVEAAALDVPDGALGVDEDGVGDGLAVKELAEDVLAVDDGGEGGGGLLDVGARSLRALGIDGYGEDLNALGLVPAVVVLPDRQLLAAGSPGGPHEEDELLATIGVEGDFPAVEGLQRNGGECSSDANARFVLDCHSCSPGLVCARSTTPRLVGSAHAAVADGDEFALDHDGGDALSAGEALQLLGGAVDQGDVDLLEGDAVLLEVRQGRLGVGAIGVGVDGKRRFLTHGVTSVQGWNSSVPVRAAGVKRAGVSLR